MSLIVRHAYHRGVYDAIVKGCLDNPAEDVAAIILSDRHWDDLRMDARCVSVLDPFTLPQMANMLEAQEVGIYVPTRVYGRPLIVDSSEHAPSTPIFLSSSVANAMLTPLGLGYLLPDAKGQEVARTSR